MLTPGALCRMTKDGPTPEIAQLSFAEEGSTDSSKKPAVLVKW